MTPQPTGWRELTRTTHLTGTEPFEFVDGPARGEQHLNVVDGVPALYAVIGRATDDGTEEVVYLRKGMPGRFYFEYTRPVLNLAEHITCPRCGRTSAHPQHVEDGWCSPCRSHTQRCATGRVHSETETARTP